MQMQMFFLALQQENTHLQQRRQRWQRKHHYLKKDFFQLCRFHLASPQDVLWGSFITHSFIPHGRLLNTADIYVLVCLNKLISGQLFCHDQPAITSCDTSETAPTNYSSLFQRNMHGLDSDESYKKRIFLLYLQL